ncbi:substrate-binding periplasmic protein [Marinigracilibium pacificum]|uniref:Transporter substrate-binding domain-containing protein n=1 Tax=Marinigracilibium pacificum TaxID=2729599 RepID=A0A848IVC3_9BACT|nr:transporter substrate-binding domain-containing protein [Marinigracilibium pacificum]NMM47138.1 transporter substrate-binding domain-containing protein [Marinigracilibium pacificum]
MKSFIFNASILLMLIAFIGNNAFSQTTSFSKAKETGSATIEYVYLNTPGFIEKRSGSMNGLCYDIIKHFETWLKINHGISIKGNWVETPDNSFTSFMQKVKSANDGTVGVANITITPERETQYTFSSPFINNISILVSHNSIKTLSNPNDIGTAFKNMTAVTVKGSTNEKYLRQIKSKYFKEMKIEYLNSNIDVSKKVSMDPKYFSVLDFTYYLSSLKDHRTIKRQPVMDEANEYFGFIMPLGSSWGPVFSEFLSDQYLQSGQYRSTLAKHLGPNALKLLDSVQ